MSEEKKKLVNEKVIAMSAEEIAAEEARLQAQREEMENLE